MDLSVRTKIIIIVGVILLVVFSVNGLQSTQFFREEYSKATLNNALIVGESLNHQLNKILKMGIELENIVGFEEQCREIDLSLDYISNVGVIDLEGEIIFSSDAEAMGRNIEKGLLDAILNEEGEIIYFSERYGQLYVVEVPVIDSNEESIAFIVIGVSFDFINQKAANILNNFLLLALISFFVAIILIILMVSRWVTTPIKKMRDATLLIGKGKTGVRINIKSKDELGELSNAFNQMFKDIDNSRRDLEKYSKQLEKQVKERTKELEVSKKVLESRNFELERFNKLAVGRELKMIEFKKRIKELERDR